MVETLPDPPGESTDPEEEFQVASALLEPTRVHIASSPPSPVMARGGAAAQQQPGHADQVLTMFSVIPFRLGLFGFFLGGLAFSDGAFLDLGFCFVSAFMYGFPGARSAETLLAHMLSAMHGA